MAWSMGHPDNRVQREQVLAHLRQVVAATDLPVNAHFESGFGAHAAGQDHARGNAGRRRAATGRPGSTARSRQ